MRAQLVGVDRGSRGRARGSLTRLHVPHAPSEILAGAVYLNVCGEVAERVKAAVC
jgi:hypothetical protein